MRKNDLTNRHFGKLTVKGLAGQDAYGNMIWWCQCSCNRAKSLVRMKGYVLYQRKYPECPQCTEERARRTPDKRKAQAIRISIIDLYLRGRLGKTRRCEPV